MSISLKTGVVQSEKSKIIKLEVPLKRYDNNCMMNEMNKTIEEVQDFGPGFYYQAGGAFVSKRSPLSGELNTVWIPNLEPESVDSWLNGEYIQDALF